MAKFRKRPIIVEATQWLGWEKGPDNLGVEKIWAKDIGSIKTLEGHMVVSPGDWIVIGVKGERYPVKPEIFAETFGPWPSKPKHEK